MTDLQPYLGADGHLVALREGDLAFLHVHPEEGAEPGQIRFAAEFPSAGPLPPVPAVPPRWTGAHGRPHGRGAAVSAAPERLELPITGMTCASCASRIEKRLNKLEGVEATVNYATERASVSFDPARGRARAAASRPCARSGTTPCCRPPRPPAGGRDEAPDESAPLRRRLIGSAVLSLPVLLLSMIPALQFDHWQWLALQLATPVVVWGAWPFHRAAWLNLRHGAATMDTLISLGTLAALGWSVVALFALGAGDPGMRMPFELVLDPDAASDHIYLEVAAVVTTFLLAGRYFEARAKRRSGAALRALLELGAKEASLLGADGDRAARADRPARRGRPLRGAAGRADRDRRRRGGGRLGGRPLAADRRERAGRGGAGRRGGRRDGERRRAAGGARDPGRAPTPRWRRSGGW